MGKLTAEARDVRYVAITFDPTRDDPAALRAYAERFALGDRWRFLTGPADEVARVVAAYHAEPVADAAARAVALTDGHAGRASHGAAVPTPRAGQLYHPSVVLLIDGDG